MDHADPRWRPIMDLEGLTSWRPGRTDGYEELAAAIAFEDQRAGGQPGARQVTGVEPERRP